jgi:hypothetical protein
LSGRSGDEAPEMLGRGRTLTLLFLDSLEQQWQWQARLVAQAPPAAAVGADIWFVKHESGRGVRVADMYWGHLSLR